MLQWNLSVESFSRLETSYNEDEFLSRQSWARASVFVKDIVIYLMVCEDCNGMQPIVKKNWNHLSSKDDQRALMKHHHTDDRWQMKLLMQEPAVVSVSIVSCCLFIYACCGPREACSYDSADQYVGQCVAVILMTHLQSHTHTRTMSSLWTHGFDVNPPVRLRLTMSPTSRQSPLCRRLTGNTKRYAKKTKSSWH